MENKIVLLIQELFNELLNFLLSIIQKNLLDFV